MRKYLLILICLLSLTISSLSLCATINCYSGGHIIYHGVSNNFSLNKDFIIISYKGYDDVIFRKNKTSPNCVFRHVTQ